MGGTSKKPLLRRRLAGRKRNAQSLRSLMLECVERFYGHPAIRERARRISWRDAGGVGRFGALKMFSFCSFLVSG